MIALFLMACDNNDYGLFREETPPAIEVLAPKPEYAYREHRSIVAITRLDMRSEGEVAVALLIDEEADNEGLDCIAPALTCASGLDLEEREGIHSCEGKDWKGVYIFAVDFSASACHWILQVAAGELRPAGEEDRCDEKNDVCSEANVPLVIQPDERPSVSLRRPYDGQVFFPGDPVYVLANVEDDFTPSRSLKANAYYDDSSETDLALTPDDIGQVFRLFNKREVDGPTWVTIAVDVEDEQGGVGSDSVRVCVTDGELCEEEG